MLKFFRIPFAQSGARTAVPDAVDPSGFVSYTEGYGADYQRQKTDPLSKNIERDKMNEILFDLSNGLAEIQSQGVPDFITSALNGGSPYPYAQGAIVRYSGAVYQSLFGTNTTVPTDLTKWGLIGVGVTIIPGDGVTDVSARIDAANGIGQPVVFLGVAHIGVAKTLTVPIVPTWKQCFTPTSLITIDNGQWIRPDWFGSAAGNIMRAVNAGPAAATVVEIGAHTYPPSYNTATGAMFNDHSGTPGVDYMVKKHVRIQGTKLPEYAANELAMQNGSIIQGPFYVSCECDGFEWDEIGVDCGTTVVTALYGGAEKDAFGIVQSNKTTPLVGKGINIGSVRGLCKTGSVGVHAVLIEAVDQGSIRMAEGRRGYHGVAIKSRNMTIDTLAGHGNSGEDVIIKSDTYAACSELSIGKIFSSGLSAAEPGVSLVIQAAGSAGVSAITIGSILSIRKDWALVCVAGSFIIADVTIGTIVGESEAAGGIQLNGDCRRTKVGIATFAAVPTGVYIAAGTNDASNTIDDLSVANATAGVDSSGRINIGKAHFDTVTNALVFTGASAKINLDSYTQAGAGAFWALTPAFANGWVNHAGGDAFKLDLRGGRVQASGLLQSGTATGLTATLDARLRPTQNYRFPCIGYNGTTYSVIEVVVTTTGSILASNFAAASSYVSLSGVNWPIPF